MVAFDNAVEFKPRKEFTYIIRCIPLTWNLAPKHSPDVQLLSGQMDANDAGCDPAPAKAAGSRKEPKVLKGKNVPVLLEDDDDDDEQGEDHGNGPKIDASDDFITFLTPADAVDGKNSKIGKIVPGEFRQRPAFIELEQLGLTEVPNVQGCGIFLHKVTSQWHSRYGHYSQINTAPTWNDHLRSERKALLMALLAMWRWYANETKSSEHLAHVAKLESALDKTSF